MNKKPNEKKEEKRTKAFFLLFLFLSVLCGVFGVLAVQSSRISWIFQNRPIFYGLVCGTVVVLGTFSAIFTFQKKETLMKLLVSVYVFLAFCFILIFVLQKSGFFEIVQSSDRLQQYLETTGAWMPFLYVLLQYLQVVILPIPSLVSTVAGVAIFGASKTFIYSVIGIVLGSFTAFYIGRNAGYKAVSWMIGEETLKKWQKKLKGKDNLVLTLMFLLPLFPDDVLCFIAGLSSMSTKYFVVMIVLARLLALSTTCYSVDFIPFNTWWGLLIWGVIAALFVVLFVLIYKNLDKIQSRLTKHFRKWKRKRKKTDENDRYDS